MNDWLTEAIPFLAKQEYQTVIDLYEKVIAENPDEISNYWYLGLAYLLAKREEEAQTSWFFPFTEAEEEEMESLNQQLVEILEREAQIQEQRELYRPSWLIRQYIRQFVPNLINNLLQLLKLELILQTFDNTCLTEWHIIELVKESPPHSLNQELVENLLKEILSFPTFESVDFAKAILIYAQGDQNMVNLVFNRARHLANQQNLRTYGIDLLRLCLEYEPNNLFMLKELFWNYVFIHKYDELKKVSDIFEQHCQTTIQKAFGSYQRIYVRMLGADWLEAIPLAKTHQKLLNQLADEQPDEIDHFIRDSFIIITQPLLYINDQPRENRYIINQLANLFQKNCQSVFSCPIHALSPAQKITSRKLRIGYIAHTMTKHPVGWLSRWLMHYHNRDEFVIACYFLNNSDNVDEVHQKWFREKVDIAVNLGANVNDIISQIERDEIDILVDLDSFTFNITGCVMALKPAPIQVSWLGMDSNGIPAIDYFIADPYVLPKDAQEYYQEKIWRLPNTYLGIDGFELDVPNLTRTDLDIPEDAIIYFNIQNALKRHPDTIRTQMKILKAVPDSYLLIKGTGKQDVVIELFSQIAESEGVDTSRLRFLDRTPNEAIHRANLQIADIVLDTYPYNGATTTLETLWAGIPLVTRVGEQFAARNSYTFMMNVGVTEGMAYSEEEYIEWGIKFGTDESLRQKVAWKLRQSRQTSPLWDGKQFTREMEKAYQQMWKIYLEKN